jgi:hypothetical protein
VHSFRGLRTSDRGALLPFCYIFILRVEFYPVGARECTR